MQINSLGPPQSREGWKTSSLPFRRRKIEGRRRLDREPERAQVRILSLRGLRHPRGDGEGMAGASTRSRPRQGRTRKLQPSNRMAQKYGVTVSDDAYREAARKASPVVRSRTAARFYRRHASVRSFAHRLLKN